MLPSSLVSDPAEISRDEGASMSKFEQVLTSASGITPEFHQEAPRTSTPTFQAVTTLDEGNEDGHNYDEMSNEVRTPLHTISNGEELATTVQDLLRLSDSGNSVTYESGDDEREFSSRKLKINARQRQHGQTLQRQSETAQRNDQLTAVNDSENGDGESNTPGQIIPEIRECDLVQFQSRPTGDCPKLHCLDVLMAGDSLDKEIENFKSGRVESWKSRRVSAQSEDLDPKEISEKWIRRIRINSGSVIEMLRELCPQAKGLWGQPIVFHRPFQVLVDLHREVKEQLIKMTTITSGGLRKPVYSSTRRMLRNKDSLDQLACFVDFMDGRIMPDSRRYRNSAAPLPKTIRYDDLWYLLKPGDLVYVPQDPSSPDRFRSTASRQQIFRVVQTHLTNTSPSTGPIGLAAESPSWSVLGHFIEHDGASYAPVEYIVPAIQPYEGERKVTDLPVYPVSYLEDNEIIAQAIAGGTTYVDLTERRFGFYSGWTRTEDTYGPRLKQPSAESGFANPERIESDILVDNQETFNAFPDWRPPFYQGMAEMVEKMDIDVFQLERSDLPLLEWDNKDDARASHFEQVLNTDQTEVIEAKRFLTQDVLGQFERDRRKAPIGEYLALLPRRFFAYAVLERKFVQLDTRFVRISDLDADDKAFERLEIDMNYKQLVFALVKSHFDMIETQRKTNVEIETHDLIRDKGKGVIILLQGVPGVGKTATAEAIALKCRKPLFPITCGDLGFTVDTLKRSLNEIFRLAHHWGCILLLEEADVFLTKRDRSEMKRNALATAFLRALEYYDGIMFLTTDQTGVLDEAIKSRVHLNLYYDHLTEEQTVAIFKQHIQRLRDIERQRNADPENQILIHHKEIMQFARDHFNSHSVGSNRGRWNGRQIRNAFLIASSLAHYDSISYGDDEDDDLAEPRRKIQKQLGRREFERVAKTTLLYDKYRQSVHSRMTDDDIAFERQERTMPFLPRPLTPVRTKNMSENFG